LEARETLLGRAAQVSARGDAPALSREGGVPVEARETLGRDEEQERSARLLLLDERSRLRLLA
jgi:hypothetical protein